MWRSIRQKPTRRMLSVLQPMLWRNPTDLFPIVPWSKNTRTSNSYPDSISKESRWSQDSRSSLSIFWIKLCQESQKFLPLRAEIRKNVPYCYLLSVISRLMRFSALAKHVFSLLCNTHEKDTRQIRTSKGIGNLRTGP